MAEMRALQKYEPPKHDCLGRRKKKSVDNSRLVVEMQLTAIADKVEQVDEENSAHQFSVRSFSIQCDSVEKNEIEM